MTLVYFILILGITVFIHELGHFIFAKKAGIYVYEFSIGMGPRLFKFNRKNDETEYSIRLFPIGGYVQMAGEEVEMDEKIPENRRLQSKTWLQKTLTVIAGVMFNFLLAILLLFIIGMVNGTTTNKTYIGNVTSPALEAGLKEKDKIIKINGKKIRNNDQLSLELNINIGKDIVFEVEDINGNIKEVKVSPISQEDNYKYGIELVTNQEKGFFTSIKYAFVRTFNLIETMFLTLFYLITGKLSLSNLSGPIGIFSVVGEVAKTGFINLVFLLAYISINVGVINLLPLPAFDGGRVLFLIIEKIKGSPVNPKVENIIHSIGLILLMGLMILITFNDIIKLF